MKRAKQILSLVLALLMVIGIPMSVSAAENFELLSVTATGAYTVELKFNAEVADATIDIINQGNATGTDTTSNKVKAGIVWVKDDVDLSAGLHINDFTVGTRIYGTVAFGKTKDTLVWTITSTDGTKVTDLVGKSNNGYTRKFFLFDDGNGGVGIPGYIAGVLSADGRNLTTPTPRAGQQNEYLIADIAPIPELELLSATAISETQIELKFSEALNTTDNWIVNQFTNKTVLAGIGLISDTILDGQTYYSRANEDYNGTITLGETDDTLIYTITGNTITYFMDNWKMDGYSVKFFFKDGGAFAGEEGEIFYVQTPDGRPLVTPQPRTGNAGNEYLFKDIEMDIEIPTPFELESAEAINDYQIELKFSEAVDPTVINNYNAAHGYLGGLVLVSDEKISNGYYDRQNEFTVPGVLTLGETDDTLLWTLSTYSSTNSISNIVETWAREDYTVKFGFKDNDCGNFGNKGEGYIGAILSDSGKALTIPADYVRPGAGQYEYMFMDITFDTSFRLLSATAINDYQVALKFSEDLNTTDNWIVNQFTNGKVLAGIGLISDSIISGTYYSRENEQTIPGTITLGESDDTLIWTVNNPSSTQSVSYALENWKKDGFSVKFWLKDGGDFIDDPGIISFIQTSDGRKLNTSYPRPDSKGSEYMFADIDSFVGYAQGEVIELQDKDYHFMNADTGRSLVVNGVDEFTIVRKADNSNVVMLMVGDQYVNLHTTPATLGATKYEYMLEACAYDRYRLLVSSDLALADGDEDTSNAASLAYTYAPVNAISGGWYLTASGDAKPLRILPIGDSITYGSVASGETYNHGWRDTLSSDLVGQVERIVFVGSQTSKTSTIDEKELYRHEGNPGWTVSYIGSSLNDIAAGVVDKYDPDVVLLMAGINDMAAWKNSSNNKTDEEALSILKKNYKDLLDKLTENMEEDDVIFCSTLTPTTAPGKVDNAAVVYEVFPSWVKEWAAEGLPVVLNDNYSALYGQEGICCSDNLHLSSVGDALVAQQYAKSILNYYNADGTAMDLQERINAAVADGLTEIYLNGDTTAENLTVNAGVTLDLNGHTLTAANLNSYGNIIDSSKGDAVLKITDGTLFYIYKDNPAMALYDAQAEGYRFFDYEVNSMMKEPDNNTKKFGVQIDFEQAKAYELLAADGNADTAVSLDIVINGQTYTHTFSAGILAEYAEQAGAKLGTASTTKTTLVLTVTGYANIPEGTMVTVSGSYVSTTGVASSFSY